MKQVNSKNRKAVISSDGLFESIQGEGASMGSPAVFLRLQGCNLRCIWCDTKYTWEKDVESVEWTSGEIAKRLETFTARRLVITGGEPLLQMELLEELISKLDGWKFEIETNGTIEPSKKILENCQLNVSPKLSNSGAEEKVRLNKKSLSSLKTGKNVYFKFVINDIKELGEVDEIVKSVGISKDRIIIMPEGIDSEMIRKKMLTLLGEVIAREWRILPRLHIYLWGNKRKV